MSLPISSNDVAAIVVELRKLNGKYERVAHALEAMARQTVPDFQTVGQLRQKQLETAIKARRTQIPQSPQN